MNKDNPVGTEYIIMEKVPGESLASRWSSLPTKELVEIFRQIVDLENRLFTTRFSKNGSLYYREDLEEKGSESESNEEIGADLLFDRFGIRPIVSRSFWVGERGQMALDREPCL